MSVFEEEKEHLEYTLEEIEKEIERNENQIKKAESDSRNLSFEDRKRGAHFQLNVRLNELDEIVKKLQRSRDIPYFGRIDVSFSDDEKMIYIGKSGISANNETIVTDWRAPVCSLYYDSEIGDVTYDAYGKLMKAYLKLKRQINIKDGKLIDAQDSSLVVNDELLKPYLNINADNKMKIIVASIQKEQNDIIRKPNINLIVQGVAGSGKTSVALHRIAYLIYTMHSSLRNDQFLIIGPNSYFLNYISSILPELETSPVEQETLLSVLNSYTNEKYSLNENSVFDLNISEDEKSKLLKNESFKTSLEYKKALDKFIDNYLTDKIVTEDFVINDQVIFTKEDIKETLFSVNKEMPNFNRMNNYYKMKFKSNIDEIIDKVTKKYKDLYMSMPFEDPRRRAIVEEKNKIEKEIRNNGLKLLNKYFKSLNKSTLEIYMSFINDFEKYNNVLSEKEVLYLKKYSLLALQKKKVGFEDIPALMYIHYCLTGEKLKYKQIVIDEAQDYGLFHFYVLKQITDECHFSIYGDLAQSIYSYRSIKNWEEVNEKIFENSCDMLNLSKSYRTTIEITENANSILRHLNMSTATPVVRHGENVSYYERANDLDFISNQIITWLNDDYKTSAVICKNDTEVKKVVKYLQKKGLNANTLTSKDKVYDGRVFVLTSASSKGLEFDTVIINDASDNIYSIDSDVDMHLLYVASTRALHEQIILYDKKITPVYEENLEKTKVKNLVK